MSAAVPGVAVAWSEALGRDPVDLPRFDVLQVGGARLQAADAHRVIAAMGCRVQQVYGMAEGLLNMTRLDDPADVAAGTQGRPICDADEWRLVDDADADVAPPAAGELWTRGPYTVRRYLAAPEVNTAAFTPDGYYRTGDIVRWHPSGNFLVEGRRHDVINRGGEKVSTQELEGLLAAHEDLIATAAVAMPSRGFGRGRLPVRGGATGASPLAARAAGGPGRAGRRPLQAPRAPGAPRRAPDHRRGQGRPRRAPGARRADGDGGRGARSRPAPGGVPWQRTLTTRS